MQDGIHASTHRIQGLIALEEIHAAVRNPFPKDDRLHEKYRSKYPSVPTLDGTTGGTSKDYKKKPHQRPAGHKPIPVSMLKKMSTASIPGSPNLMSLSSLSDWEGTDDESSVAGILDFNAFQQGEAGEKTDSEVEIVPFTEASDSKLAEDELSDWQMREGTICSNSKYYIWLVLCYMYEYELIFIQVDDDIPTVLMTLSFI